MTEQELEVFLKQSILRMEDYLLTKRVLEIDEYGIIDPLLEHINDADVEIYLHLAVIKAGFGNRNKRIFKNVNRQLTEQNIMTLVDKFDNLTKSLKWFGYFD